MTARKTKASKLGSENKTEEVNEFMAQLSHPLKAEIEALRSMIRSSDPQINESIKWNAPSFFTTEHFATLKLRPLNTIQVVFHTGAKAKADITNVAINDPSDLLTWITNDRCIVTFSAMNDIEDKQAALIAIVRQWIDQMPQHNL